MAMTDFELSRIYGKGWSAAKKRLDEDDFDPETIDVERLNPCSDVPARDRWAEGFRAALQSRAVPFSAQSTVVRKSAP